MLILICGCICIVLAIGSYSESTSWILVNCRIVQVNLISMLYAAISYVFAVWMESQMKRWKKRKMKKAHLPQTDVPRMAYKKHITKLNPNVS